MDRLLLQAPNTLGVLAFPAIERMMAGGAAFGGNFDFGLRLAFAWSGALFITASLFTSMEITETIDGLCSLGVPGVICFTSEHVLMLFYVTIGDLFQVMDAMKLKGLGIETRNPIRLARKMTKLAIPMFMTVLQHSNTMMSVLKMRGYTFSRDGRELRPDLKLDAGDVMLVGAGVTVLGVAAGVDFGLLSVPVLPAT
jgi:energy-coupling factor transporter transmembrane protein EcfT